MGQCDQAACTSPVSEEDIANAVAVAKESDVMVVNVAMTMTEG